MMYGPGDDEGPSKQGFRLVSGSKLGYTYRYRPLGQRVLNFRSPSDLPGKLRRFSGWKEGEGWGSGTDGGSAPVSPVSRLNRRQPLFNFSEETRPVLRWGPMWLRKYIRVVLTVWEPYRPLPLYHYYFCTGDGSLLSIR